MLLKKCNSLSIWPSFDRLLSGKNCLNAAFCGKIRFPNNLFGKLVGATFQIPWNRFLALECNINRAYNSYYASVVQPIPFVMPYD